MQARLNQQTHGCIPVAAVRVCTPISRVASATTSQKKPRRRYDRYRAVAADVLDAQSEDESLNFHGVHHVGLLCENLEISLGFYRDVIGLEVNPDRPDSLPYRGAWLWIGTEMIHLMELPNPDPKEGRPKHGGRDRHFCVGIQDMDPLVEKLKNSGVNYTESMSGRRAVFFRDPDMNCLEVFETKTWH